MKANVLLQGEVGTGKTRCIITQLPEYLDEHGVVHKGAGLHPFFIPMEPGALDALGANICGHPGAPTPCIHHHRIYPEQIGWAEGRKWALLASTLSYASLMKTVDPNKSKYTQFLDVYDTCAKFICDACGQDFGDIGEWGEDRAINLDGLTGLTKAARQMIIGAHPVMSRDNYQPVQGFLEGFLETLWGGTNCTAVVTAHTYDPTVNTGEDFVRTTTTTMLDTAGPALVRKLVRKPSEIITCERGARGQFLWNTLHTSQHVNKQRRLPEAPDLAPDFAQLFKT